MIGNKNNSKFEERQNKMMSMSDEEMMQWVQEFVLDNPIFDNLSDEDVNNITNDYWTGKIDL